MTYAANLLVLASLYSLLSLSLNLVVGYAGLLSLCHAAFYGVGAYASTLLIMHGGWSFFPAAIAGSAVSMVLAVALGFCSVRLRGDYFVLATLGFQVIAFSFLNNWFAVTGGSFGIGGIPTPHILGIELNSVPRFAVFSMAVTGTCAFILWRLSVAPFGRALRAIREDEDVVAALGKDVVRMKISAFAIAAAFAAIAGALFAGYARYIDPTSFTVGDSILMLSMVAVGGSGGFAGPIVGAVLLVTLPEVLRFLLLPDAFAAPVRQIIYGSLLVVLMRVRPTGLMGRYGFD